MTRILRGVLTVLLLAGAITTAVPKPGELLVGVRGPASEAYTFDGCRVRVSEVRAARQAYESPEDQADGQQPYRADGLLVSVGFAVDSLTRYCAVEGATLEFLGRSYTSINNPLGGSEPGYRGYGVAVYELSRRDLDRLGSGAEVILDQGGSFDQVRGLEWRARIRIDLAAVGNPPADAVVYLEDDRPEEVLR
ncbi:hypothetical protein CGZ98_00755 [Enemella evansiae]|uniref:hypothetical protein n=1 Tax=Enemella evansiae TaxID=2016499 RepID=UPI000B96C51E|nr:hypothetical protein [Enemella evansiae]OYO15010.1 hypothetical protein CGZ98_00755 [Enemella evansiae]